MKHDGHRVTRAQFEENFLGKMSDPQFTATSDHCCPLGMSGTSEQRPTPSRPA